LRPPRIRNIVITRSKEGNEELSGRLRRAGFVPIPINTISLSPPKDWAVVDGLLRRLHSFDWLVFTSATGAEYFAGRMKELSLDLGWQGKPLVACVGERTAERLSAFGVKPSFIPTSYLTQTLAKELPADRGRRVLLLRADIADPKMLDSMRERGFEVEEASIYSTGPARRTAAADERLREADLIVFASPSAVRGFCRMVPPEEIPTLQRKQAVCIGPVTAAAAGECGFARTIMPKSYTLDAVVEEIVRLSSGRDA